MIAKSSAKKLVIYVNALQHHHHKPLYEAIVEYLYGCGCAGATVTRGVAGYGQTGEFHEAKLFSLSDDVPMRIEVVDNENKIEEVLPTLHEMVGEGMIAISDVEIVRYDEKR